MSTSLLEPTEEEWREVPERAIATYYEKLAAIGPQPYSPSLRHLAEMMQILPSTTGIPNKPGPLMSMIVSGLGGAGLGYGAGWLGEKLLPSTWQRGRLRRTAAIVGGLAGALPGALWGYSNLVNGHGLTDGAPYSQFTQVPDSVKSALFKGTGAVTGRLEEFPLINKNSLNQTIWSDPLVSPYIPLPVRAATSSLVLGAAHLEGDGRQGNLVSPLSVGQMAVGLAGGGFKGWLAGVAVGKALGILSGAPPETQDFFKTTGMYAGVINAMVPKAFGAR